MTNPTDPFSGQDIGAGCAIPKKSQTDPEKVTILRVASLTAGIKCRETPTPQVAFHSIMQKIPRQRCCWTMGCEGGYFKLGSLPCLPLPLRDRGEPLCMGTVPPI